MACDYRRSPVNYGPLDPALAREIFIRQALVAGEFHSKALFLQHNRQLLAELEELEIRARRDLMADEEALYRFYDERIAEGIYSGPSLRLGASRSNGKIHACCFSTGPRCWRKRDRWPMASAFPIISTSMV